ncbi:unnamed protein product [Brachionus calyciflorus]|uniref:Uncharacterized protein n=1 Tax=Brachionus calyciflorus TaxID=104777 RepID=A0A813SFI8_9BILA|nr:unnamed protein product [Brachionus calyciflorus]
MTVRIIDKNENINNNNSLNKKLINDEKDVEFDGDALLDEVLDKRKTFIAYDIAYHKEMKARLRNILIYSILFSVVLLSPVGLMGFYFGLRARMELGNEQYPEANKYLTKADYSNLIAFISSAIFLWTVIIIGSLFIYYKSF